MATVPTQDRLALTHPQTGITVGIYPSSDPTYDLQVYRAASTQSVSQPTSSNFSELATLGVINGGARVSYQDNLPLSKTWWWYKARSVRTNVATPSAFTTAVTAQAGLLPTTTPGAVPYSGGSALRPIVANNSAYRSSNSTAPTQGGSVNPGIARDFWLSASLLRPAASSASFVFSTSLPASVAGNIVAARGAAHRKNVGYVPFQLPAGSYFSQITVTVARKGAQSTATVKLLMGGRNTSTSFLRTLATWTATAGAVPGAYSTSPRFWIQPDKFFLLKVTLDSSGGAAGSSCAQFIGAGVTVIANSLDIVPAGSP